MINLNDKKKYRDFSNSRNDLLELILKNTQKRITDILDQAFIQAMDTVKSRWDHLVATFHPQPIKLRISQLEKDLGLSFDIASARIVTEIISMRRKTFLLSYAGEAQAIELVTNKQQDQAPSKAVASMFMNQSIGDYPDVQTFVDMEITKVKRKIVDAAYTSACLSDTIEQALGRIYKTLPRTKSWPSKPKLKKVKKIKESNGNPSLSITVGPRGGMTNQYWQWDETTWDQIIKDYQDDYIPISRSPTKAFNIKDPVSDAVPYDDIPKDDRVYGWEVEKEVSHDFVKQVRSGQIEAANNVGIDDFVWIAILDDKTCEYCCEWRNGKTSKEIEKILSKNKELADYCDAIVPPAHPNCRCTPAPVATEDLETVDTSKVDKEFDEWLND